MKRIIVLGVLAAMATGCIRNGKAARDCVSGREKLTLHVNSSIEGAFEHLTFPRDQPGRAVFTGGFLPNRDVVDSWTREPSGNRNYLLKRDIDVFRIESLRPLKIGDPFVQLVGARVVEIDAAPARDNARCLVVSKLVLQADEISGFTGQATPVGTHR